MKEVRFWGLHVLATVLSVSACGGGGGGGDSSALCRTLSGGGTQVSFTSSPACPDCTSTDNANAADCNFESAATMQMGPGGTGTIELRATAQPGVVYPAGSSAGFVFSITADNQAGFEPSIVTYLGGTRQETQALSINGIGGGSGSRQKSTFRANQQFDAVALNVVRAAAATGVSSQVFEYCAE